MTSDFFIEEADSWRKEIWQMVKERKDLNFYIITKRIERFNVSIPDDWKNCCIFVLGHGFLFMQIFWFAVDGQ